MLYPDIHTFLLTAGPIVVEVPVSMSGQPSLTQWTAVLERSVPNPTGPHAFSVSLSSPASASIGVYTLQMRVEACLNVNTHSLGQFTLLCNPWCQGECCLCPNKTECLSRLSVAGLKISWVFSMLLCGCLLVTWSLVIKSHYLEM